MEDVDSGYGGLQRTESREHVASLAHTADTQCMPGCSFSFPLPTQCAGRVLPLLHLDWSIATNSAPRPIHTPPAPRFPSDSDGGPRGGREPSGAGGGVDEEERADARALARRAESKDGDGGGVGLRVEGGSEVMTFG